MTTTRRLGIKILGGRPYSRRLSRSWTSDVSEYRAEAACRGRRGQAGAGEGLLRDLDAARNLGTPRISNRRLGLKKAPAPGLFQTSGKVCVCVRAQRKAAGQAR